MKKLYISLTALFCGCFMAGIIPAMGAVEDVTSQYVTNYNFTGDKTVWNIEQNSCNTNQNENCQEFWTGDTSKAWFKMSQTLTNLPQGVYRLTINAFTRADNHTISQTAIYANTTEKAYMTSILLRHQDTSYGSMPNAMNTASEAFYSTAGQYWLNTIDNIMVTDGTLTIGARNVGQLPNEGNKDSWTILGNVKLYRLSGSDLQPLMSQTVSEAQALADEGDFSGKEALETAITNAQSISSSALTLEDITSLQAAMEQYRNARLSDATETNGVDATHFIQNAGFEDGAEFKVGTANGNYSEPKGWTLTYGDIHINNNAGMACSFIEQAGPNITIPASEGDWAYSARMRWSTNSYINLTQEVNLPAGSYTLSAALANLTNDNPPILTCTTADGTEVTKISGSTTSLTSYSGEEFTLDFAQTVTIRISLTQNGQSNTAMAVDDLRLTYYGDSKISEAAVVEQRIKELNAVLEIFVDEYNNSKFYQRPKWNELIDRVNEAELLKDGDNASESDVLTAIDNLKKAMYGTAIDPSTGDATALIKNPTADDALNGWTQTLTGIRSDESWRGTTDNYFDGGTWSSASGWNAGMQQELYLPAGYYALSAIGRCSPYVTMTMSVNGQTCTFPSEDSSGGNIWAYASEGSSEATANEGLGRGWNKVQTGFYLAEDTECTIEIKAVAQAVEHQWYSIDDFALAYASEKGSITASNNRITAQGAIYASELAAAVTAETRSIDLRDVNILIGDMEWPATMNPNCVIYAPVGLLGQSENIVCNDICRNLTLTDKQPFNVPEAFTAKSALYTRNAYADGLYETIVLPFEADMPEGQFVWEEITEENNTYIKTGTTNDIRLLSGKAYLMKYTGNPQDNTVTQQYLAENVYIDAFSAPETTGLFGSTDIYTVESESDNIYMLSAADSTFRRATAGSTSAPFRACYQAPADVTLSNLNIFGEATAVETVTTATPRLVNVYTIDGRIVKQQVDAEQATEGLRPGIYIVNDKSIIIK